MHKRHLFTIFSNQQSKTSCFDVDDYGYVWCGDEEKRNSK